MKLLSSLYYLTLLLAFLTTVSVYLWFSWKSHTLCSYFACIVSIMGLITLGEFYRELTVCFTQTVPELTYARVAILRMEHTWLGLFIGEVFIMFVAIKLRLLRFMFIVLIVMLTLTGCWRS